MTKNQLKAACLLVTNISGRYIMNGIRLLRFSVGDTMVERIEATDGYAAVRIDPAQSSINSEDKTTFDVIVSPNDLKPVFVANHPNTIIEMIGNQLFINGIPVHSEAATHFPNLDLVIPDKNSNHSGSEIGISHKNLLNVCKAAALLGKDSREEALKFTFYGKDRQFTAEHNCCDQYAIFVVMPFRLME